MSLFHKSQEPSAATAFSPEESVIAILYLAVTADGEIAREEEELVIAASNRMKLLRAQSIDDFNRAVATVRATIDAAGREKTFSIATAGLPGGLQPTIYALAADVVFAQGMATAEENAFVRQLQEALQIPDDLATRVVEVMRLKNCG